MADGPAMHRLLRRAALILPAACLASAVGAGGVQASISLGVNTANAPDVSELHAFSQLVGMKPKLVMWYQSWAGPVFYPAQMARADLTGATPVVTWAPQDGNRGVSLRLIARGRYDRYLAASATAARAYAKPFFIRFGHEMNLPGSAFGPGHEKNRPRDFRRAWRHVVAVFRAHGATNVRWVWSPNVDCAGRCPFKAFYPGNRWVDWVGLDGYNYASVDHTPWLSLTRVFQHSYRAMRRLTHKPFMIAETASTERGGNKATWIRRGFSALPRLMPQVRVVIWFDRVKETDWRVDSSPATLGAFRAIADSPLYSAASPLSGVPAFR